MLKIQQLRVSYGGIQALRGIDLEVPDGKIVSGDGTRLPAVQRFRRRRWQAISCSTIPISVR